MKPRTVHVDLETGPKAIPKSLGGSERAKRWTKWLVSKLVFDTSHRPASQVYITGSPSPSANPASQ
jgi:hypothetical protein